MKKHVIGETGKQRKFFKVAKRISLTSSIEHKVDRMTVRKIK